MPILEAKDLIKLYVQADSKLYAVNRVDFSVEDGEFIAIIGPPVREKAPFSRYWRGWTVPPAVQ